MAVGFLVAAAGAQPAAAGAQSLQQTAGQTVPTTLTAPDPYPRDATTFLTRGGQQIAVRPLRTTLTAGGARVVADRILVNFNQPVTISDLADIQAKATRAGAGTALALVRIGAGSFMIDVTGAASIEAAAQAYKNVDPRVVGAGPDYMMHGDETPNDTDFGKQTDMAVIQAPSAGLGPAPQGRACGAISLRPLIARRPHLPAASGGCGPPFACRFSACAPGSRG
jgi:hypothetical protein